MTPVLKAPGTKLLKLKYDKLLSNVAFTFNLRRYTTGALAWHTWDYAAAELTLYDAASTFVRRLVVDASGRLFVGGGVAGSIPGAPHAGLMKQCVGAASGIMVGRCRLKPVEPRVESAWCQRFETKI